MSVMDRERNGDGDAGKAQHTNRIANFPFDPSRKCEYPEDDPDARRMIPANTRGMPEYAIGQAAFAAGSTDDDNPYPCGGFTGAARIAWFTGFYDARTNSKLAGPLSRNGLAFP